MAKKIVCCLAIIALSLSASYTTFAEPNTTERQTIEESKIKYQQLDNQTLEINSEITKLNNEIEELNNSILKNNDEIDSTTIQINLINSQMEDAKKNIEENQKTLDNRIRSMYKSNLTASTLSYLITSESIFDMFNRVQAISKIIQLDKQIISDIKEKTKFLEESSDSLKKKNNDLNYLRESMENDLNKLVEKQKTQENTLADLNAKKEEMSSLIEANEKELISHPIAVINSDSSTSSQLQEAINTLQFLIPQLNSEYVIGLSQDAISAGNARIQEITNLNNISNSSNNSTSNNQSTPDKLITTFTMSATAYSGGTLTAMGLKPIRDPNGISTIAVDPSVIPLGSKVFVEGYGYAIASDTGGAIKGNKIDLYLNTHEECIAFGRQNVTLQLVAKPGEW
ncbi:3D domain-containing protein [Clostridium carnis]